MPLTPFSLCYDFNYFRLARSTENRIIGASCLDLLQRFSTSDVKLHRYFFVALDELLISIMQFARN